MFYHFKVAKHHFKLTSDFPHFSDEDPEAGDVRGKGWLKDLPLVVQLTSVESEFELRCLTSKLV